MTPSSRRRSTSNGGAAPRRPDAADQDRLAAQDRVAEDREALAAQRRPGLDDVGDDVGDARG